MDEKQLVCEGACNPDIRRIDALAHDDRSRLLNLNDISQFYRSAKVTAHFSILGSDEYYKCGECGHMRRFGGNPPPGQRVRPTSYA